MINNFITKPLVLSIILALISTWKVQAEVVIDGSLGGKAQNLSGPIYNIHEGLGQRQGVNVFHSFSQFNINSGDHAIFSSSAPTQNILARVTGGQSSLINGKISSDSSANLWLMNPAGWVVGGNAQLNVQGAFHLSSAHSIGFSGGSMFFADPASNSKLSTATPIDYQFNKGNQATITLDQADLIMPENADISIVGGDINMKNSTIRAPGGRIVLASNSGQGQWHFDKTGITQISGSGGIINIMHDSRASLFAPSITNSDIPSENARTSAGTLQITGEQINLKNATIVTDAWNNKNAGDTTLQANIIHLDSSFISNTVQGSKNAGNASIIASDLIMDNGSKIGADTRFSSTGHGGNISLNLKGKLLMNDLSLITSNSLGNKGGDIQIQADNIEIHYSALKVSTATDSHAGNLNIVTNQLTLTDLGTLDSSTGFGKGNGGVITINANRINLNEEGLITSTSGPNATGNAGVIDIHTNNLSLSNDSVIRAESLGTGATGVINLDVNGILKLQKNSKINTLAAQTDGGTININSQGLAVQKSQIVTSAEGLQGNGGDITINTDTLILSGGFIQANTAAIGASGGDINVNASNTIASSGGILKGGDVRQKFSSTSNLNVIQAAAPDGINGQVDLSTVELNIAGQLAKIDSNFSSQKTIANDPCNVARNEKMSSLIQSGKGGLPVKASDNLNLPLHRHLLKDKQSPHSRLDIKSQQLAFLTAHDVCKQDLN